MKRPRISRIEQTSATSVNGILSIVLGNPNFQFYRGQSSFRWRLIPRLGRVYPKTSVPDTWVRIEAFLLRDFKKYAIPHLTRQPISELEWLFICQHYGLPTRLLDWTTNPLKALYFAVADGSNRDGALFAFEPTGWIPFLDGTEDFSNIGHVMPLQPSSIDARIAAQESCFMLFPHPQDKKPFTSLTNTVVHNGTYYLLLKIRIPSTNKPDILRELDLLGINQRTLFPDLPGVADYVTWKHLSGNG